MSSFMKFWKDLNEVLTKHNLHEMKYGDARDLFNCTHKVPEDDKPYVLILNRCV